MQKRSVGRPKENNPKDIKLSVRFTQEEHQLIEELASVTGMSKAKLIRSIVLGDLSDAKFLQSLGSLPLIQKYKEFVKSL